MKTIIATVCLYILIAVPGTFAQSIPGNMVRINGGTFMMGSPVNEPDRDDNESQHQVTVSGFYMGKYEVTQKEYQEVTGENPDVGRGDREDNLPVQVSWNDAVGYCNRRSLREGLTPAYTGDGENVTWNQNANGYRLPTEAEWEYACRAGTTTTFNTGNNITTDQANYHGSFQPYNNSARGESRKRTTPVGSFEPNAWGLYDMHGNVSEWCWEAGPHMGDSGGPISGGSRRIRGGSWDDPGQYLRSAFRGYGLYGWYDTVGFRLVRSGDTPLLDMSNYTATHHTIDNLRLRETASTSAKLVTTLPKGTEVQVIETGPATTIDGISASWVRVTSGNGYTGWCFGGYLEEIKKPDMGNSVIESQGPDIGAGAAGVIETQGNELIQNDTVSQSLPLWALLTIIAGAVAVAGGVAVLFIVKRKRQR